MCYLIMKIIIYIFVSKYLKCKPLSSWGIVILEHWTKEFILLLSMWYFGGTHIILFKCKNNTVPFSIEFPTFRN